MTKQGPNPFTKLTDRELDDYRKEVELKQKGLEGKAEERVFADNVNQSVQNKVWKSTQSIGDQLENGSSCA